MEEHKYDIFISYRRDGGAQYARILQLMLIQRGYKVFLDYDELKDGVFGKHIKAAIKEAPVFMLVLSKGALERCKNDDDWLREEITYALEQGKHIIPVNPDKSYAGVEATIPEKILAVARDNQHSEIDFGQSLGVTIDLMINNRLVPTLGRRNAQEHKDEDYATAQETLRKMDAHNRFMKRLGVVSAIAMAAILLGTCFWFWQHQKEKEQQALAAQALSELRTELEKKHKDFNLQFSDSLTETQMRTIDTLLDNMSEVRADSFWVSQFEFTVGQWYGILGGDYDPAEAGLPMTDVSYGDIYMKLLGVLPEMTNIGFVLPTAEEWLYAAKGGEEPENTQYAGSDDVDAVAWYKDNSGGKAHPSDGQQGKEPNILDLYDMSGNVAEWCNSPFSSNPDNTLYTICGGDFNAPASEVTVLSRKGVDTNTRDKAIGFRLAIKNP